MATVYQRLGGFAGFQDVLHIEGNRTLRTTQRGQLVRERPLGSDEADKLQALIAQAKQVPAPSPSAPRASDTFRIVLTLDGETAPRVELTTLNMPEPGSGEPWGELLGWLQKTLDGELFAEPKS